MRRWLLSIGSAGALESVGLWLIIAGLVGEALLVVLTIPPELISSMVDRTLTIVFTLIIAAGVWLENVGATAASHEKDARIAEAKERTAKAELELAKVQAQIAPRILSPDQQERLYKALLPFGRLVIPNGRPKVLVISYGMDTEGAVLGSQLIGILQRAGIDVVNMLASEVPIGSFAIGIHIAGTNNQLTLAISEGLAEIGDMEVTTSTKLPSLNLEYKSPDFPAAVLIGTRPVKLPTK